jgi:hypothetical protein
MRPARFLATIVFPILALLLALVPAAAGRAMSATDCEFKLGFKALHDLAPEIVGECTSDETHNPENGDALQTTTNGLLAWRKADNWTAFTNGTHTWINGPFGLQDRPNEERFPWESAQPTSEVPPLGTYHCFSQPDLSPLESFVLRDGGVYETASGDGGHYTYDATTRLIEWVGGPYEAANQVGHFLPGGQDDHAFATIYLGDESNLNQPDEEHAAEFMYCRFWGAEPLLG